MAGEITKSAEASRCVTLDGDTADQHEKSVAQPLQEWSIWQSAQDMAILGTTFGAPSRTIQSGTDGKVHSGGPGADGTSVDGQVGAAGQAYEVGPLDEIPKLPLPGTKISDQMLPGSYLTVEERAALLEKYGQVLKDQEKYARRDSMGTMLMGTAAFATSVYRPLRIAVGGFAAGYSLYNGHQGHRSQFEAKDLLSSMPKFDAQRFGKFQESMKYYGDTTSGAYLASLGLGALHFSGAMKSAGPLVGVSIATLGLDGFTSGYLRPKAISNFNTDFEAWKAQMKK